MTQENASARSPEAPASEAPAPKRRARRFWLAGGFALLGLGAAAGALAGGGHGRDFAGRGIERVLRSVDASETQRSEIRAIYEATRGDLLPLRAEMGARREQVDALLKAQTLDRAAFETLRQEALAKADAASARALTGFLDAAEKLTPEQRAELLERRAGFRHGPGPGWR
ncbi:Spy/CpxP family protein refolding chaperone [Neomegalonema perideroedes]|uniref:Spy/CpxP family protein refolding chaperone n=1 Tax=Neomegalonema perideroedes TaxID=217219 RepID=UPI00037D5748|nr:periplasmic heavy metal sensor [Neomegalonema perideroedes]